MSRSRSTNLWITRCVQHLSTTLPNVNHPVSHQRILRIHYKKNRISSIVHLFCNSDHLAKKKLICVKRLYAAILRVSFRPSAYASVTNALRRPYGGRTMSNFTKSYGHRTVAVRFLRAPYGRRSYFYTSYDRTAAVWCQILQNRTAAVRSPYDFYGHRTVAVAIFTHRTMPLEVLTRSYNFSRHRTMSQPQTASYGRRTAAVRRPYGRRKIIFAN